MVVAFADPTTATTSSTIASALSTAAWCANAASGPSCPDSSILDQIGASTVTVQVTPNTGGAWICPAGSGVGAGGTISLANGRFNLQVNSDFHSCAFGSF